MRRPDQFGILPYLPLETTTVCCDCAVLNRMWVTFIGKSDVPGPAQGTGEKSCAPKIKRVASYRPHDVLLNLRPDFNTKRQ
jgi:hypothetical protein